MKVRLSPGMVVEQNDGRRFIVIASGRDRCYSSYVQYDDGTDKLLTEVPYWQEHDGRWTKVLSHRAKNKKWAAPGRGAGSKERGTASSRPAPTRATW